MERSLNTKTLGWALLTLALFLVLWVRLRLLAVPLERDEGEYAYFGHLMLQGIAPFKLAYDYKMPGLYLAYALCMAVFGQTTQGIHLGLLAVNLGSVVLLFFLARRLFGPIAGIFSALSYALLSLSQSVFGAQAHATHFVVLFALGGCLSLLKAVGTGKKSTFFWSGFFFGCSFLMKQPGIFFALFGLFILIWDHYRKNNGIKPGLASPLSAFCLGALSPFAATCALLYHSGVFDKFWFWTFDYASHNFFRVPLKDALGFLGDGVVGAAAPFQFLWYMAVLGALFLFTDAGMRPQRVFLASLSAFSFLSICPGLMFYPHYFVTLLPAVSLLAGGCMGSLNGLIEKRTGSVVFRLYPLILFTGLFLLALYQQRDYLFNWNPAQVSRQTYGSNPFVEAVTVADYIQRNSEPGDTILVLGSEPEIYFYSQRRSATGYLTTYDVMQPQPYALEMQREMIREIESARPRFLVLVGNQASWEIRPESEKLLIQWGDGYIRENYEKVGLVDIVTGDRTDYYWESEARNAEPRSQSFIKIFKRQS